MTNTENLMRLQQSAHAFDLKGMAKENYKSVIFNLGLLLAHRSNYAKIAINEMESVLNRLSAEDAVAYCNKSIKELLYLHHT